MIVQRCPNFSRLITQEQHALVSGMMAHTWRGVTKKAGLHGLLVQATGMHDNPWRHADEAPKWNNAAGDAYDFISMPNTEKIFMYGGGIDQLERVHPYIALLVSLHYTTFPGTKKLTALQQQEHRRRIRLQLLLPDALADESRWARDLAYLKFFDNMSLFVCLTAPIVEPEKVPPWIDPSQWAKDPDSGAEFSLDWLDPSTITMHPFPFAGSMYLHIYYREIADSAMSSESTLLDAWHKAPPTLWTVELKP